MTLLIRERAPLRLAAHIASPSGSNYRWAADEPEPENAAAIGSFSTVMPGGFDQCSLTLPRKPSIDYRDLERLATVTLRGAGGSVAYQGRLDTSPRTSGYQLAISPGLVGWQAHLDDDSSAREIYVDQDLSAWQGASVQRQINILNTSRDETDASVSPDASTGAPALITQITGPWSRNTLSEGWYDSHAIPIGGIDYAWTKGVTINYSDANWGWQVIASDDDLVTSYDTGGNLRALGPGIGNVTVTVGTRRWILAQCYYNGAGGGNGTSYPVYWTCLTVYGRHGLALYGTPTQTSGRGVLCSDVEANAISRWAPKLSYSTDANGTIQPSAFVIPQLRFLDPTTASAIIKAANQYELRDWAVWEGPTYYSNPRGARGRNWRARVGPSGLQETGPQTSRLFGGVVVAFSDVVGVTRTVGPPGSNANTTDPGLQDPDPANPANELGIRRWSMMSMGTTTPAGAIKVGQTFLANQKLADTSGQANLVGHVEDDHGVLWPAWMVRAGDTITFLDAHDPVPRRIVSTSYTDATKTNQVNLDSPPDGLQSLLERLSVSLTSLGFA